MRWDSFAKLTQFRNGMDACSFTLSMVPLIWSISIIHGMSGWQMGAGLWTGVCDYQQETWAVDQHKMNILHFQILRGLHNLSDILQFNTLVVLLWHKVWLEKNPHWQWCHTMSTTVCWTQNPSMNMVHVEGWNPDFLKIDCILDHKVQGIKFLCISL